MNKWDGNTDAQRDRLAGVLTAAPFFRALDREATELLAGRCCGVTISEGEALFLTGDAPDALYVLLDGRLSVRGANEEPLSFLDPVQPVGEMGVFTGDPRSAQVIAVEDSELLRLDRADLLEIIDDHPRHGVTILRNVVRILATRVTEDNQRIRAFQDYLLDMENKRGESRLDRRPPSDMA